MTILKNKAQSQMASLLYSTKFLKNIFIASQTVQNNWQGGNFLKCFNADTISFTLKTVRDNQKTTTKRNLQISLKNTDVKILNKILAVQIQTTNQKDQ